ncbi:MAG: hypothetical protein VR64_07090 [Desulfatitalea sp. BRH_c12]|nr:MAG: hypothetical protein VR64_07090 [Desulfatitalea sp. BRH_c12]
MDFLVPAAHADQVIGDDLIVTGSECVGVDCVDGEFFGYVGGDTLRLKDNNLRIHFDDTSDNTFPSNDWRILINDITSGGASYFAVEDSTAGRIPFKIEAKAPADALTISRSGRIGFGTAIPQTELHIFDGDTPTIRFEQDGSGGWAPQTWEVAGNEAHFFIRDVTNGSRPLRIKPGTPGDTLCLRDDGVGFGTWAPAAPMELETTAKDAEFLLDRTDGASGMLSATAAAVVLGSKSDHPLNLVVNSTVAMTIDTVGRVGIGTAAPTESLHVVGNALVSGNLEVGSSRGLKQNIEPIDATAAMAVLAALRPVKFNYKIDPEEESLGFIAEEVPDLVATNSRKSLSPMDLVAVLAKVAQEQQQTIETLSRRVADLEKELERTSPVVSADPAQQTGSGI